MSTMFKSSRYIHTNTDWHAPQKIIWMHAISLVTFWFCGTHTPHTHTRIPQQRYKTHMRHRSSGWKCLINITPPLSVSLFLWHTYRTSFWTPCLFFSLLHHNLMYQVTLAKTTPAQSTQTQEPYRPSFHPDDPLSVYILSSLWHNKQMWLRYICNLLWHSNKTKKICRAKLHTLLLQVTVMVTWLECNTRHSCQGHCRIVVQSSCILITCSTACWWNTCGLVAWGCPT